MTNEEAISELNRLFPYIREYQKLAREVAHIQDIFQDIKYFFKFFTIYINSNSKYLILLNIMHFFWRYSYL